MSNEHIPLLKLAKRSWLYPIYIPSYSRAGTAPLLEMLKKATFSVQSKVHIVVRPSEKVLYKKFYPWATVVTEKQTGIGPARMRCLTDAEERGYSRIVVLDDDIIHVSLLEQIHRENLGNHTRRFSSNVSGMVEPDVLIRSLMVGCKLADSVFHLNPKAAYGAARNALFSGDQDTAVGATLNKGSFPACVMFMDVGRFKMRYMPMVFRHHGEDLAMFLDTMTNGMQTFTLPTVAYDQHSKITSTIPLDPQSVIGRPHMESSEDHYPHMHQFLRVSMRNKLGGVMRIGVNWRAWYAATSGKAIEVSLDTLIEEM